MAAALPSTDLQRLTRFAIFGSETGLHKVHVVNDFTKENTRCIDNILTSRQHSLKAVKRLKQIFNLKCFARKESLLYALARIVRNSPIPDNEKHTNDEVREAAYLLILEVCETADELFTFVDYNKRVATPPKVSWGRGMRDLVHHFYEDRPAKRLITEVTRCKSGRGFSHRDLLKMSHIDPERKGKDTAAVVTYLLNGKKAVVKLEEDKNEGVQEVLEVIKAVESLNATRPMEKEVVRSLIEHHSLIGRQVPSWCFQHIEAFEGSLGHMTLEEVMRAVPKMAALGMLDEEHDSAQKVIDRIQEQETILAERLNPVMVFNCLKKYEANRSKKWVKNIQVVKAFWSAYQTSIQTVPSTGKRHLVAIHVNRLVTKLRVIGSSFLSPTLPCAVMAHLFSQTEDHCDFVFFHGNTIKMEITRDMNAILCLEQILTAARDLANESCDLSQPFTWAANNRRLYDNILVMTDKKSVMSGGVLRDAIATYRSRCIQGAKVAIVGLSDTLQFPNTEDLNYLDVCGFDEEVLPMLHKFFAGWPVFEEEGEN